MISLLTITIPVIIVLLIIQFAVIIREIRKQDFSNVLIHVFVFVFTILILNGLEWRLSSLIKRQPKVVEAMLGYKYLSRPEKSVDVNNFENRMGTRGFGIMFWLDLHDIDQSSNHDFTLIRKGSINTWDSNVGKISIVCPEISLKIGKAKVPVFEVAFNTANQGVARRTIQTHNNDLVGFRSKSFFNVCFVIENVYIKDQSTVQLTTYIDGQLYGVMKMQDDQLIQNNNLLYILPAATKTPNMIEDVQNAKISTVLFFNFVPTIKDVMQNMKKYTKYIDMDTDMVASPNSDHMVVGHKTIVSPDVRELTPKMGQAWLYYDSKLIKKLDSTKGDNEYDGELGDINRIKVGPYTNVDLDGSIIANKENDFPLEKANEINASSAKIVD